MVSRIVIVAALWAVSYFTMPWIGSPVGGFFEDDSWFYCQIAYNWATLGIPTFDTIHETSGFHLAWGLVLSGASSVLALAAKSKLAHASLHAAIYLATLGECAWLIVRRTRHPVGHLFVALAILLLGAFVMETALLSACLLLLAERLLFETKPADGSVDGNGWAILALSALCVLSRIDALLILVLWTPVAVRAQRLPMLLGGALFGALVHFSAMHAIFGEFFSVSSLLKANTALTGLFRSGQKLGIAVRVAVLFSVLSLAAVQIASSKQRVERATLLLGACVFSLAHLAVSEARSWYFLPAYALALRLGLERTASSPSALAHRLAPWIQRAVALTAAALMVYKAGRIPIVEGTTKSAWDFVENIPKVVPPGGRIFEIDASGFPGYWGKRPLINGDGLVNTHAYARRLRTQHLDGYLQEERICYVITTSRVRPRNRAWLLRKAGLAVRSSQAKLVLSQVGGGTQLWRLTAPYC